MYNNRHNFSFTFVVCRKLANVYLIHDYFIGISVLQVIGEFLISVSLALISSFTVNKVRENQKFNKYSL